MRTTALVIVFLFLPALPHAQMQGLTKAELERFDPDWRHVLSQCQNVERTGVVVELRCPSASMRRITVNVEDGTVLKVQSRRGYIRTILYTALTILGAAGASVAVCQTGVCD